MQSFYEADQTLVSSTAPLRHGSRQLTPGDASLEKFYVHNLPEADNIHSTFAAGVISRIQATSPMFADTATSNIFGWTNVVIGPRPIAMDGWKSNSELSANSVALSFGENLGGWRSSEEAGLPEEVLSGFWNAEAADGVVPIPNFALQDGELAFSSVGIEIEKFLPFNASVLACRIHNGFRFNISTRRYDPMSSEVSHPRDRLRVTGRPLLDSLPFDRWSNALQGTPPANAIERLLLELQRMRVGWAGENTVPPSDRVNADIERTVNVFPSHLAEPDVDVDPDSGFVTLRWLRLDRKSSFALQFDGSGSVVGVLSQLPKSGHVPWTLHVSDEASLARKFEDDAVKEHLTLR